MPAMDLLCRLVHSSIGKKVAVAAMGLLLCGFLVTHLAGNLLLLVGPEAFNHYAEALEHNPLLYPAEAVLFLIFATHIVTSLWLKIQNKQARPIGYASKVSKGGSSWGSSTMAVSGSLVLLFLIIHIKTFKFGDKAAGLFQLVLSRFAYAPYALFYVVAMGGLALHLSHGIQSAFRTFGLSHPRYVKLVEAAGLVFALVICGGFAMLPLWGLMR
jgi:succinate dehydrogenase / fumarate reductase, cytochrome b subunit